MKLKKKAKLIIVFIVIIALCIGAFFAYKEVKRNIEYKKVFKKLSNKVFYNNNPDFKDIYYDKEEFIYELELKDDGTYKCYVYSDITEKGEPHNGKWEISYYNDGLYLRSNDSGINCSGHYDIIDNNILEGTSPDIKNMKLYNRKSEKNGFTGTIYTINYCEGKDHCDKLIRIGKKIPSSIKQYKSSEVAIKDFNNKKMYYKHIIKNDIVKESYVEFIIDNNMVSLKGADSSYYEHNKNVLLKIFDSNNCTISDTNIHCSAYGMYANAFQNGYVEVGYSYWNCYVSEKGNSLCSFGK